METMNLRTTETINLRTMHGDDESKDYGDDKFKGHGGVSCTHSHTALHHSITTRNGFSVRPQLTQCLSETFAIFNKTIIFGVPNPISFTVHRRLSADTLLC